MRSLGIQAYECLDEGEILETLLVTSFVNSAGVGLTTDSINRTEKMSGL